MKYAGQKGNFRKCKTSKYIKKWLSKVNMMVYAHTYIVDMTDYKQMMKSSVQVLYNDAELKLSTHAVEQLTLTKATAKFEDSIFGEWASGNHTVNFLEMDGQYTYNTNFPAIF